MTHSRSLCLSGATPIRRLALGWVAATALLLVGFVGVARADVTTTEGQSFSGHVADTRCSMNPAIDWGDGTPPTAGSADASGVSGTHVYSEEGTYSGTAYYTCPEVFGNQTTTFQANVQDAPLTASGRDSSGAALQSLSAAVAHFADTNPAARANDFSAQISWGDGTSSAGTVASAAGGGFDVTGSHTYNTAGSYPVSATITDRGGATTNTNSTAQISVGAQPAPPTPRVQRPTASFATEPSLPCGNQSTILDASTSRGLPGRPITYYVWTIVHPPEHLRARAYREQITTRDPQLEYFFQSSARLGGYRGQAYHTPSKADLIPGDASQGRVLYNLYDYQLLNPQIQVELEVEVFTGVPGPPDYGYRTASTSQTIRLANPVVSRIVGYATNNAWAIPGFAAPTWLVSESGQGRCNLNRAELFGDTAHSRSIALAGLTGAPVTLIAKGKITFQARCQNPVKDCIALIDIVPGRGRDHGRRSLAGSLSSTTFVVAAGKTTSVTVPLNARGRALARAHRLSKVTLLLGSVGAHGMINVTRRTITIIDRRAGRH
jgi:hypothetical protein